MTQRKRLIGLLASIFTVFLSHLSSAQTLDKIKQRGMMIVGVNTDYRPFGYLDPSGAIVGMEPDLAKTIAEDLHVKLEMVPVQAANRMEFLRQGRIDLILASMSYTAQRAKAVGMIDPAYYDGGTALLARKSVGLTSWEQLRGKSVCGTQGAYYNRPVAEKYGADIVAFPSISEAENALMNGSCVGYVEDSGLLYGVLASGDPKWADYSLPLPIEQAAPWVIGVPLDELNSDYGQAVSAIVTGWQKNGTLIEVSDKWHLPVTDFLKRMHEKYSK